MSAERRAELLLLIQLPPPIHGVTVVNQAIIKSVPRIDHLHGMGIRERIGAPWKRQLYRWSFRDAWVIHLAERLVEGAIPEIIEDGETGLLVPRRDPAALASSIEALLSDPGMQRRMGARARVRHEQRYTLAAFERNLAAALEKCTDTTSAGSRA